MCAFVSYTWLIAQLELGVWSCCGSVLCTLVIEFSRNGPERHSANCLAFHHLKLPFHHLKLSLHHLAMPFGQLIFRKIN